MLLVALATLAGTIGLYVIVPKGFLPQQDTGVIMAVTAGRAEHLHPAPDDDAEPGGRADRRATRRSTGVVSFVGAGAINATPNTGQLTIALKPLGQRERRGGGDRPAGARRSPRSPG